MALRNREVNRWNRANNAIIQAQKRPDFGGYDPVYLELIDEARSELLSEPPLETARDPSSKVEVFVRKRPLNAQEKKTKQYDVVTTIPSEDWGARCVVHEPKKKVDLDKFVQNHRFNFDMTFGENCDNEELYQATVRPLLRKMATQIGTSATVFAYGQTGSGKTHTISSFYVAVSHDIFEIAAALNARVSVRFFEVYGGKAFDLLAGGTHCLVQESAKGEVCIVGLTDCNASSPETVEGLIDVGLQSRKTGSTSANAQSSRSHSLFEVQLTSIETGEKVGKMTLVDLAGSERGADRGNCDSKTRREGAEINKSLLALKECIRSLYSGSVQHVPFRGSRLTHIMRDAFVGAASHTIVVACVSPASASSEHTLNTLRYASRIKEKSSAGGCGGDKALNGGVGGARKPQRLRANSISEAERPVGRGSVLGSPTSSEGSGSGHSGEWNHGDVLGGSHSPTAPSRCSNQSERSEPLATRASLTTPPTPMRPSVVDGLLNLKYKNKGKAQKKKGKPRVRQPEWSYEVNEASEANWLVDAEKTEKKEEPKAAAEKPRGGMMNQTIETKAIRQHDESIASRCHGEKAMIDFHGECCSSLDTIHNEDRSLVGWAMASQMNGELDANEYMTRVEKLLNERNEVDKKLRSKLEFLKTQVAKEEQAEANLETLLNQ